ncbi:gamma-glutamyltransferase [Falsirhodobacter halotolerans]|uniref:gamma-glutamyltransferase n=1 Tax=Falsirhodobacter halotolerans TaxID=1146892 RepID=UPI001FD1ED80|nr:gamma-glutamyltransferase [Falsirhodobacter halotolerans]MCJ8139049.1 gamma-glutamyltransferase [Falsirhodobacter halotolerans]
MTAMLPFTCEKRPAHGAGGMVVANHPMGAAAGAEMLAAGGNAVDAAVATLLTLTVVEPMMVGIAGGGLSHIRMADGTNIVIDALSSAAASMTPDMYTPVSDEPKRYMDTVGRRSMVGASAVAVPGNLRGWCDMQARFGKLPFADVVEPAIRAASRGFTATHYLAGAVQEFANDLLADPAMAAVVAPKGDLLRHGDRVVMGDYAESLRLIQTEGAGALHGGALGAALVDRMATGDDHTGFLTLEDLAGYTALDRTPIAGTYRGYEVIGPPPPASSGVHITQMLNILEGYDVKGLGFGTPAGLHLLAEVLKIAFADRRQSSGDPAFVDVPVARLTSKAYAADCAARIGGPVGAFVAGRESADTTHVTVADKDGNIVTATHTINGLFGARFVVPGTGIIPNNYMMNFDPRPGKALSVVPGKRVPTSMAPMIVMKDGRPAFALGMPGGLRIFPSILQGIVNLIDHGMTVQEAVEAPRIWTEGHVVEVEKAFAPLAPELQAMGHDIKVMPHIGGGMNAIEFGTQGDMTGAACWRADGTAVALGGGLARPGVRFWPDRAPDDAQTTTKDVK